MANRRNSPSGVRRRSGSSAGLPGQTMSRRRFLGTAAAGMGAAVVGLGGVAKAQVVPTGLSSCEVYPTGDPTIYPGVYHPLSGMLLPPNTSCTLDVLYIQAAVLQFGEVLLKYVPNVPFHLGDETPDSLRGTVFVLNPLTLVGDGFHPNGEPKTRIVGGGGEFGAFTVETTILHPPAGGKVTMNGLRFHEAMGDCVLVVGADGFEFINNMVTDLIPMYIPPGPYPYPMNTRFACFLAGYLPPVYPPPSPSGDVLIEGNTVIYNNPMPDDPNAVPVDAGMGASGANANITIRNNYVSRAATCLFINHNTGAISTINGNVVESKQTIETTAVAAIGATGTVTVTDNQVTVLSSGLPGFAFVFTSEAGINSFVVSNNRVMIESGLAAMVLGNPTEYCPWTPPAPLCGAVIINNQFSGYPEFGILVIDYPGWENHSHDNLLVGNNIATLNIASKITYMLGQYTYNNIVKGYTGGEYTDEYSDYALDLGMGGPDGTQPNYLTGVKPMSAAGGIGPQMSQAAQTTAAAKAAYMRSKMEKLAALFQGLRQQ